MKQWQAASIGQLQHQSVTSRKLKTNRRQLSIWNKGFETDGGSNLQDIEASTELKLCFALKQRHQALGCELPVLSVCQKWLDKLMSALFSDAPATSVPAVGGLVCFWIFFLQGLVDSEKHAKLLAAKKLHCLS